MVSNSDVNSLVLASTWQHLRRLGKSSGINLTPEARSFWYDIPESVPREAEWTNPKPVWPPNLRLRMLGIAGALLFWTFGFFVGHSRFMATGIALMLILRIRPSAERLRRVVVREDGLELETTNETLNLK